MVHGWCQLKGLAEDLAFSLQYLGRGESTISAASICTGWGVADMVIDAVNSAMSRHAETTRINPIPEAGSFPVFEGERGVAVRGLVRGERGKPSVVQTHPAQAATTIGKTL